MTEMTELTDDRLYELLPAIHRMRDEEQGFPLRALLRVLGEQAGVLEADIAQLYENLFIDTCQQCAAVKHCSGFFKSHTDRWQSRGVQLLSPEAFSAYTRSAQ